MLHECPICGLLVEVGIVTHGICFECNDNYITYKDVPLDYLNNDGLEFMIKYHLHFFVKYTNYFHDTNCT